ncbi:MAG: hypothetical protein OHK0046_06470 [Anaerolineae bacterium]
MTNDNLWLIHSNIMRDVVSFLEAQDLIPTSLAIQGDGWVEALFKDSPKSTWYALARQRKIDIEAPLLTVEEADGSTLLRVKFRLTTQKHLWPRLFRRTS